MIPVRMVMAVCLMCNKDMTFFVRAGTPICADCWPAFIEDVDGLKRDIQKIKDAAKSLDEPSNKDDP